MSVASAVYDGTCVVCDYVNNIIRRVWLRMQRSRQLSANYKIYEEIRRFDDDAGYHLANMNIKIVPFQTANHYYRSIVTIAQKTSNLYP